MIDRSRSSLRGKEIFFVTPIKLGGSPTDLGDRIVLDREAHIQAVRYWNAVIRKLKQTGAATS